MFDQGCGATIVVVQPVQGRWEWTRPLLVALAKQFRVISYSLSGELGSGRRMNAGVAFEEFVGQLGDVMDHAGVREAALCGISFGGTVAAKFAAEFPERVTRLIIVSSPGPGWRANSVQASYLDRPWASVPSFIAGSARRTQPEIDAAIATRRARAGFKLRYGFVAVRYPSMPHLMARRVRLLEEIDLVADCGRIKAPTLVVTGEPALDTVVPVESTRRYLELIRAARYVMMDNTGHQGVLTQPERFAALVSDFVNGHNS